MAVVAETGPRGHLYSVGSGRPAAVRVEPSEVGDAMRLEAAGDELRHDLPGRPACSIQAAGRRGLRVTFAAADLIRSHTRYLLEYRMNVSSWPAGVSAPHPRRRSAAGKEVELVSPFRASDPGARSDNRSIWSRADQGYFIRITVRKSG